MKLIFRGTQQAAQPPMALSANGICVEVDGVDYLEVDGVPFGATALPVVAPTPTPTPVTPTLPVVEILATAYFDAAELKQAVRALKPGYDVRCDSEHLDGSGLAQPVIWYTSQPTGTVTCANPEHPYFSGNVSATASGKEAPTTVGSTFVPGVTSSANLPSVPAMSTGYRFFEHGPAVGTNSLGQPIDAEGRTAGPIPAPSYESEIGNAFRTKFVVIGGERFDAWGNKIVSDGTTAPQVEALFPIYANLDALLAAAKAAAYQVAIVVDHGEVWPGFGPPDVYATQPDASVVRTN